MTSVWKVALVALLAATAPVNGVGPVPVRTEGLTRFEFAQPHMGTLVRIILYAPGETIAHDAAAAAFGRVAALEQALSDYRDSSELTRLCRRSGGAPVGVSEDLFRVLRAAQDLARASDGAFDATAGPLSVIWRQARRRGALPDGVGLAAARALVGHAKLELDEGRRTAHLMQPGMQLDLGGIAKGFAADEVAAMLRQRGIASALIAAGGDIVATDPPPGATGWRIAVSTLEGVDRPPAAYLTLRNAAVSTSGDIEQFFAVGSVRHSHIVDPRNGRALTGRRSVTIVAPSGTTADGLATAVSVMGTVAGLRLVDSTSGAAAFVMHEEAGGLRTYQSTRWRTTIPGGFDYGAKSVSRVTRGTAGHRPGVGLADARTVGCDQGATEARGDAGCVRARRGTGGQLPRSRTARHRRL
ncbi:MAG TPA: FAD:protein FMN transferase [Vicinamibacterales bacterium]|nr:FAD:protein FMN transferase [Vicinamibacterales bacterium]